MFGTCERFIYSAVMACSISKFTISQVSAVFSITLVYFIHRGTRNSRFSREIPSPKILPTDAFDRFSIYFITIVLFRSLFGEAAIVELLRRWDRGAQ